MCAAAATITETRATDRSDALLFKLLIIQFARSMVNYIRFTVSENNCQYKTILVKNPLWSSIR